MSQELFRLSGLLASLACLWLFMVSSASSETITVEILCRKSFYTPDIVRLKKGVPAKLVLRSADVTHGFAIDELNIAREVPPGPPVSIEFTPARAGQFTFYCVVRCGKDHLKMRGTLIVE